MRGGQRMIQHPEKRHESILEPIVPFAPKVNREPRLADTRLVSPKKKHKR